MKCKTLHTLALSIAILLMGGLARAQCPAAASSTQTAASGTTLYFLNACAGTGTFFPTFEEKFTGSPSTVSVVIQGCMRGGTCDTLETYATATNSNRAPTVAKMYDYFAVTPTFTGGTSPLLTVNYSFNPFARGPAGSGSFVASGDLSGNSSSQEVIGELGNAFPALTAGYQHWTGTAWAFDTPSASLPSGLSGQSYSVVSGTTPGATSAFGLDASQSAGADPFAKAIATIGQTVSLLNFPGNQTVGTNNFNVANTTYVFGQSTFTISPGSTVTISANNVTFVMNNTTLDESLPAYNSGTPCTQGSACYSPGSITITNGSTSISGTGTTWTNAYNGTHVVCGFVDYGTFTRTGNGTGTLGTTPSSSCSGNYALIVPTTTFPFKVTGSNFKIIGTWFINGDIFTAEGTAQGHTGIEVQANGFTSDGGQILWTGKYGIDFLNVSHTRIKNLLVEGSASAGLNTNVTNGSTTTDNICDTCNFEDDTLSPNATNFGTYIVNIAGTGGTDGGWHFPNITIQNDVMCVNGILCDNTGSDDPASSVYVPVAGGQVGSQAKGTITTLTSSPTVTGVGTNFNTAQNIVGAQIWAPVATVPTLVGTVQSVGSTTGITLTANAAIAVSGSNYYFYTPLSSSSTGALGGFQPLNGSANWDVGPGKIRDTAAEATTPNGINFNEHDLDISLAGVYQDGSPRTGSSGGISFYPGAAVLGPGTVHDIRVCSSGYDIVWQLGGTVVADGDVGSDVTVNNIVDCVDPISNVPTPVGVIIRNNSGSTACGGGTRKCQWTLSNIIQSNVDTRNTTTQETYDNTGLTLTNFVKTGPPGWQGTTIPNSLTPVGMAAAGTSANLKSTAADGYDDVDSGIPAANVLQTTTPINVVTQGGSCQDAGSSGTTYACNLSPAITSYVVGAVYAFKPNTLNTGASTINFNSLGAKTIVKTVGGITTGVAAGDLRAGQWVEMIYDTNGNMQMLSPVGQASVLQPAADSTTAIQAKQAGGTVFATFDSTNKRLRIGDATAPNTPLDILGLFQATLTGSIGKVTGQATAGNFGVPVLVYATPSSAVSAAIGSTTMVTNAAATHEYRFYGYIDQVAAGTGSCSGATTFVLNLISQDPNAAASNTLPMIVFGPNTNTSGISTTVTAVTSGSPLGAAGQVVGSFSFTVAAKASTVLAYSTTSFSGPTGCTTAPTYQIYPFLEVLN